MQPEEQLHSIIHDIKEEEPQDSHAEPSQEIVLLPGPPKKQRKPKKLTIRDKSKKIVKEVYPLILKRTEGNYRLIGRTIRMLYSVYLHHTQEKLKEPLTLDDKTSEKTIIDIPPKEA